MMNKLYITNCNFHFRYFIFNILYIHIKINFNLLRDYTYKIANIYSIENIFKQNLYGTSVLMCCIYYLIIIVCLIFFLKCVHNINIQTISRKCTPLWIYTIYLKKKHYATFNNKMPMYCSKIDILSMASN